MTTPGSTFSGEPGVVPFSGQAVQVWSGTRDNTPILFSNQDQSNTVYLSYQNNVAVGDTNAVPLGPQSTVTMNGSRSIYAVAASGTKSMIVLPGGGSFFQRLLSLTLPTGATSGERITLNGSTGTITGYAADGSMTFNLAPFGFFFYDEGVLVASSAGAAGTNDGFGNAYLQGTASYIFGSGIQSGVALNGGSLDFWTATSPAGPYTFEGGLGLSLDGSNALVLDFPGGIESSGTLEFQDAVSFQDGINVGNGASAQINLNPQMGTPANYPTSGKTLAQTQACLDQLIGEFANRGMVVP